MHSPFSRALLAIVARHGRTAFQAIAEYLFSGAANPDVTSEALRWLGDFEDPATLPQRWVILQRTLEDQSPRVRDGAILGFAALGDPRARPLLLEAQEAEQIAELRLLIDQVVKNLNPTHASATPHSSTESLV
jgi:HEAT repeat protein